MIKGIRWCVSLRLLYHKGSNLFKEPILLITNISINNLHQAYSIYRTYTHKQQVYKNCVCPLLQSFNNLPQRTPRSQRRFLATD